MNPAKRVAAFRNAANGVRHLLKTEPHAWFHLVATIAVVALGYVYSISVFGWTAVVLAMGLVWTAEALNSAVERIVDLCSPDYSEIARQAKDLAAGAVLLASIAAAVVGLIVFLPVIFGW